MTNHLLEAAILAIADHKLGRIGGCICPSHAEVVLQCPYEDIPAMLSEYRLTKISILYELDMKGHVSIRKVSKRWKYESVEVEYDATVQLCINGMTVKNLSYSKENISSLQRKCEELFSLEATIVSFGERVTNVLKSFPKGNNAKATSLLVDIVQALVEVQPEQLTFFDESGYCAWIIDEYYRYLYHCRSENKHQDYWLGFEGFLRKYQDSLEEGKAPDDMASLWCEEYNLIIKTATEVWTNGITEDDTSLSSATSAP